VTECKGIKIYQDESYVKDLSCLFPKLTDLQLLLMHNGDSILKRITTVKNATALLSKCDAYVLSLSTIQEKISLVTQKIRISLIFQHISYVAG